jgi:hypothetical protein
LVASKSVLFVLLAALVSFAAVVAAAVFAFVRTREFFRRFRAFGAAMDEALAPITEASEEISARAAQLGTQELDPALARLNASRARLAVLLSAAADVRAAVAAVTGLRPTK